MRYKYVKWTPELESQAHTLLLVQRNYVLVAAALNIDVDAIKNRNYKHWKINCRQKWSGALTHLIEKKRSQGLSVGEIAAQLDLTPNAVWIGLNRYSAPAQHSTT